MATQLTIQNNPFDLHDRDIFYIESGHKIAAYLYDEGANEVDQFDFVVSLNGTIIHSYDHVLKDSDSLVFMTIPQGGGDDGKNPLVTIASLALAIAAPYIGGYLATGTWAAASTTMGYVYSAGVTMLGNMVINSLVPTPKPSMPTSNALEEVSPTYSYSGGSNADEIGTPLPIVFGEVGGIKPPKIADYLSLDGDKQYYNALYAINDGEVDDITNIYINGEPISNFNGCEYTITKGTINQSAIGNFRDTASTFSLRRALNEQDMETTYTTAGNAIDAAEVVISLEGLYHVEDNGDYKKHTIKFEISYKKDTDTTWTSSTKTLTNTYKTRKLITYKFENLDPGRYDFKVKRLTDYKDSSRYADKLTLDYVNEIIYDNFRYPGVALLSVTALATDQLTSFPVVTCDCRNVTTLDPLKPKDNAAWACYDALLRVGVEEDTEFRESMWEEFAELCELKNYKVGFYLDSFRGAQDVIDDLSKIGRSTIVQFGTKFAPITEKPVTFGSSATILFTSANVENGHFDMEYIPYEKRANKVTIYYRDKNDKYAWKPITLRSYDYDTTTVEELFEEKLYACVDEEVAIGYAQSVLNRNRYLTKRANFTAHVDALPCEVGDVINIGKRNMTSAMAEGRILEIVDTQDEKSITIDQEVTLEPNESYELSVNLANDMLVHVDVVTVQEQTTTSKLMIQEIPSDFWDEEATQVTAEKYNKYRFGKNDSYKTDMFRVLDISRDFSNKRTITALEYNDSVYNETVDITVPQIVKTAVTTNLQAQEFLNVKPDGTIEEMIIVSWQSNKLTNTIYLDGQKIATTTSNMYIIRDSFIKSKIYSIQVNDSIITYKYIGTPLAPGIVQNVLVSYTKGVHTISWDKVTGVTFKHYEVIIEIDGSNPVVQKSYTTSDNFLNLIDLVKDTTYNIYVSTVLSTGDKSEATTYTYTNNVENIIDLVDSNKTKVEELEPVVISTTADIERLDTAITDETSARVSSVQTLTTQVTTANGQIEALRNQQDGGTQTYFESHDIVDENGDIIVTAYPYSEWLAEENSEDATHTFYENDFSNVLGWSNAVIGAELPGYPTTLRFTADPDGFNNAYTVRTFTNLEIGQTYTLTGMIVKKLYGTLNETSGVFLKIGDDEWNFNIEEPIEQSFMATSNEMEIGFGTTTHEQNNTTIWVDFCKLTYEGNALTVSARENKTGSTFIKYELVNGIKEYVASWKFLKGNIGDDGADENGFQWLRITDGSAEEAYEKAVEALNKANTIEINLQEVSSIAQQANTWSANSSKIITDENGNITGYSFGDGSNTQSQFKISAEKFIIGNGVNSYTPLKIENNKIIFDGVVKFTNTDMSDYDNSNIDLSVYATNETANTLEAQINNLVEDIEDIDNALIQNEIDKANLDTKIDNEEQARIDSILAEQQARATAILERIEEEARLDGKIDDTEQELINNANTLAQAQTNYTNAVKQALLDGEITQAEQNAINEAESLVNSAKTELNNTINNLTKVEDIPWQTEVQAAINNNATTIDGGKVVANTALVNNLNATGGISADTLTADTIYGKKFIGAIFEGAVIKASYLDLDGELEVLTNYHISVATYNADPSLYTDAIYNEAENEYRIPSISTIREENSTTSLASGTTVEGLIQAYNVANAGHNSKAVKIKPTLTVSSDVEIFKYEFKAYTSTYQSSTYYPISGVVDIDFSILGSTKTLSWNLSNLYAYASLPDDGGGYIIDSKSGQIYFGGNTVFNNVRYFYNNHSTTTDSPVTASTTVTLGGASIKFTIYIYKSTFRLTAVLEAGSYSNLNNLISGSALRCVCNGLGNPASIQTKQFKLNSSISINNMI